MHYCPECKKPYSEDNYKCPECGYSPSEEQKPAAPTEKSSSANPLLWVGGSLAIFILMAIIGLAVYFIFFRSDGLAEYKEQLTKVWEKVQNEADDLINKSERVNDEATLSVFANDADNFNELINDKRQKINKLESPEDLKDNQDKLTEALDEVDNYMEDLYAVVNQSAKKVNATSFSSVQSSGNSAKKVLDSAINGFDFLDKLPSEFFQLQTKLTPFYTAVWKKQRVEQKKLAEAKRKRTEIAKQKQLQANMNKAKNVVIQFMTAYFNSNATSMGALLTGEAKNEFNPDIQFQGDFEPLDYTILSSEITPKKNYRFYVRIDNRDWEGVNFSDKWKFVVGSDNFLIIRRQLVN